jgi:nicotinate-nucleotide--dimethylbenzimidazole phosphoribosyltransferase
MSRPQAQTALSTGAALAREAAGQFDLVALGEMGIGNTTAAAALVSGLTGTDPALTAGPGTGLNPEGVKHKVDTIRRALALHRPDPADPVGVLAAVGGFEIGAIAGFLTEASECRLPVVLDGYPCCAGALLAHKLQPRCLQTAFFSHVSEEPGHRVLLASLGAQPVLDLGMRLGEGTGAALALMLIEAAVRLYREMATFEEAQVSSAQ